MNVLQIIQALRKGASIGDPVVWRNRTALGSSIGAILALAIVTARHFGVSLDLSDSDVADIVAGITAIIGVVHPYVTVATDANLGLPAKNIDPPPPSSGANPSNGGDDYHDILESNH